MEKPKYEIGSIEFKGLIFKWKLIAIDEDKEKKEHEVFLIEVENKSNRKKLRQEFNNSIMEREISEVLELYKMPKDFHQAFIHLRQKPLRMWAGYDIKPKNYIEFRKKRLWWFLYSVINDFSGYISFEEENYSFDWFCSNFGYDSDSIKAKEIYKDCLKYDKKIKGLELSQDQKTYFEDKVRTEENIFSKDLEKAISEGLK